MARRKKRLISVIVPAYKQFKTIKRDLENICSVLEKGLKDFDYGSYGMVWCGCNSRF